MSLFGFFLPIKVRNTQAYHTLEYNISIGVPCGVNHTRTVDEVDAPHKSNVLPHLNPPENSLHPIQGEESIEKLTLVSPAMGATLQTFLDLRVFIIELFPVFG